MFHSHGLMDESWRASMQQPYRRKCDRSKVVWWSLCTSGALHSFLLGLRMSMQWYENLSVTESKRAVGICLSSPRKW